MHPVAFDRILGIATLVGNCGRRSDLERIIPVDRRCREPVSDGRALYPFRTADIGRKGVVRRPVVENDFDLCPVGQSLRQHHKGCFPLGNRTIRRTVGLLVGILTEIGRSFLTAPCRSVEIECPGRVNALEFNALDDSRTYVIPAGKLYSRQGVFKWQLHDCGGVSLRFVGRGHEQVLLIGNLVGNRIRDRRCAGLRLVREHDALPAVGRIGEEPDFPAAAGPEIVRRPAG